MMTTRTMDPAKPNDSELVAQSLGGSREAFRQIVERYQTLICSLAYGATGSISQSQDMAQETFLAAWKDLPALREPEKLRAWLCRIVRNRISKTYRRADSDPVAHAAPLEEVADAPALGALPCEQAITREEEAILWRSLEKVPATYREPLILFYREHQSIEHVAAALELSEDAVKQRLARGRKLLQEEVQAFVEQTLVRTTPGQRFSGAVLAALPLTGGSVATTGAALGAKGAATAKTGFMAFGLLPAAPLIGLFAGFLSQLSTIPRHVTGRQRWMRVLQLAAFWILVPGVCATGETTVSWLSRHYAWDDRTYFMARTSFWWGYSVLLATWIMLGYHRAKARHQAAPASGLPALPAAPIPPVRAALNTLGIHVAMFSWLIYLMWRADDDLAAGLVAVIVTLLAAWRMINDPNRNPRTLVRSTFGYVGFCCALIVGVINLRLDVWLAANRNVSVAQVQQIYPMWLVPLLSAALGLWIGLLLLLPTRPQPSPAAK